MLGKLLGFVDRTKHGGRALRLYLWWGLLVRGLLLAALGTLLVVEGNFLAEWLLSWQVAPSIYDNVEDYTVVSYVALGVLLAVGMYLRWVMLQRMNAVASDDVSEEQSRGAGETGSRGNGERGKRGNAAGDAAQCDGDR